MFKRANVQGTKEDEFIDIGERLAPYDYHEQPQERLEGVVEIAVTPRAQPQTVGGPTAPLHLVR